MWSDYFGDLFEYKNTLADLTMSAESRMQL